MRPTTMWIVEDDVISYDCRDDVISTVTGAGTAAAGALGRMMLPRRRRDTGIGHRMTGCYSCTDVILLNNIARAGDERDREMTSTEGTKKKLNAQRHTEIGNIRETGPGGGGGTKDAHASRTTAVHRCWLHTTAVPVQQQDTPPRDHDVDDDNTVCV